MNWIPEEAKLILPEVVALRREIHRHPERGRQEVRTSALIRAELEAYGVDVIERPVPTAVVALIHGKKGDGPCLALRCDIDALPVQEETELPYASEEAGFMHACGHDMHTAMLLGVARLLCQHREDFRGTVKLIFQHSEDTLPGGAKELVEKGVLENPHVDAIFGLHVMPDAERVGQIGVHVGPMTTAVDLYDITISGKGGHGSQPQETTDPILTAAQMITTFQQIVARRIDPMEMGVFSVCMVHGGDAVNVIPSTVRVSAIARTYAESVRAAIQKQVFAIARGMEELSGNQIAVDATEGYPGVVNDEALVSLASHAVGTALGSDRLLVLPRPMAFSEDFSYYGTMGDIPSAFLVLFAGHEGPLVPLHHPQCALKEEAMPTGIAAFLAIVRDYLK